MLGLDEVPVNIKEMTDTEAAQLALIENLQRENLNPVEEAMGFKELIEKYGMTQDAVAKTIGRSRSSVSNSMRILALPDRILNMVYVPKTPKEKAMQRALLQYFKPQNKEIVLEALKIAGRRDLIGKSPKCLVDDDKRSNMAGKGSNGKSDKKGKGAKWQNQKQKGKRTIRK